MQREKSIAFHFPMSFVFRGKVVLFTHFLFTIFHIIDLHRQFAFVVNCTSTSYDTIIVYYYVYGQE